MNRRTWTCTRLLAALALLAASAAGAQWQVETVDSTQNVGRYASLALDELGRPRIAYYDVHHGDLKYAERVGTGWIIDIVDSLGDVGSYASLAIAPDSTAKIAYHDDSQQNLKLAVLIMGGWSTQTLDDDLNVGRFASLELDSLGRSRIAYENTTLNVTRFLSWTGMSWLQEDVGSPGYYVSMALRSSDDQPLVASYWPITATSGSLYYHRRTSVGWETEQLTDSGQMGTHASLALTSEDHPMIAHHDPSNGALLLHRWQPYSTWSMEWVDPGPYAGEFASLAVDAADLPRIAYYEDNYGTLRYAWHDGVEWHRETVDSDGSVGAHASLALDQDGAAHIAYYDLSQGNLKYAYHPGGPWYILVMPDTNLGPGEVFELDSRYANPTPDPIAVDEYIVLDVFGEYWFWPSWSQELDGLSWIFGAGDVFQDQVLLFEWPSGAGSATGIWFWGALLEQGETDVLALDSIEWSFHE